MDAILQTLRELNGVTAAVVADRTGRVLGYRADAAIDSARVDRFCQAVVTAVHSANLLHRDWESLTAEFSDGKLLIRSLSRANSGKGPGATLSIVADSSLHLPFAGVTIRAAVAKLNSVLAAPGGSSRAPAHSSAAPSVPFAPSESPRRPSATPSAMGATRGSAPEIVAKELAPALVAELEKYLEDLADAGDAENPVPKIG